MSNRMRNICWALGALLLVSGCARLLQPNVKTEFSALRAGQYRLDNAHTAVLFKVQHLGLSTFVGRFNQLDASLDFDPEQPEHSRLEALIEMDSLDVNDDEFADTLKSDSWLDVARYPQAKFVTEQAEKIDASRLRFTGQLSFHGITAPVTLEAEFHGGAHNLLSGYYTLGFSARGAFLRSAFGMGQHIPLVSDEVQIEVYAEFQRQE